ncbi:RNA polymerase sigma-70 factor, ECF subfamily [Aeromonas sp. RU39B]|uniref:sigma-70 family RNA polymerase sigma factor n=1 Tax=Aeromonas sp. RU39B TaxID=1907416 RepID=UPI000954E55E|nr:sigma-70 family RNA polymerase sigma factor [Aeromonas sp. RU39B]SIR61856.1 RNA polymerase sigma-70 factor, ECF subfamily [Aeromonas sp. RU39B]
MEERGPQEPTSRVVMSESAKGASEQEIIDLREQMLRFARLQLKDSHLAEDAVQEALISALQARERFSGRSSLRTWVFGILKNKIANQLRQSPPWITLSQMSGAGDDEQDDQALLDQLFDHHHHWQPAQRPVRWNQPDAHVEDGHFWRVFEACLEYLPDAQGRVFMMREFVELETSEICAATGVSVNNLNVMLHRARLRLRHCLKSNWFEQETT